MNPTTDISKDNNKAQPLVFLVNGDDDYEDYDTKEDKAFDHLVNSLDDDNLAYVSHVATSTELDTKVYDTGTSMHKHITELCILQKKLLLMGSRADHDMLGHVLYTSAKKRTQRQCRFGAVKNRLQLAQIIDRLLYKESETKRAMPLKRKVDDD
ncbi:hypothetical protein B5M09_007352 [Aphanomyces astaci]|uniref:Uncharacterized protein n=1 Tax=Aphanomyces astaci TaxID=112090 RepID=A0A3R7YF02_APHAT|nr:hypothetical protein B5M09_007352 [Aphanomyces astaci]